MKKQIAEKTEEPFLTAEEIKFTRLVSKGISYTQAYRQAYPHKNKLAYDTIRRYAFELATKKHIATEVETTKQRSAHLARLAEDRLEEILTEVKPNKTVADVGMFMYEQANGKATQRIESKSAHVSVVYDLSGKGEEVPEDIRRQLEQLQG